MFASEKRGGHLPQPAAERLKQESSERVVLNLRIFSQRHSTVTVGSYECPANGRVSVVRIPYSVSGVQLVRVPGRQWPQWAAGQRCGG